MKQGDRIHTMAGSTHRRTWEIDEIRDGTVHATLVDQAVGYAHATDDVHAEWHLEDVERRLKMDDVNEGAMHSA